MALLRKYLGRLRNDASGSMAVEFAFVAPVLLIAMIGIAELGRMFWARHSLEYAVQETARWAMIDKTATTTALQDYTNQKMGWTDTDHLTVVVQFTTESGKAYASVTATYHFVMMLGFLGIDPFNFTTSAHVPRPP